MADTSIVKLDNEMIGNALMIKDGIVPIVENIKAEVAQTEQNIKTAKGRKLIASVAMRIASTKVSIDTFGKDMGKRIMENRKYCVAELDSLRDEFRAPLNEWEQIRKDAREHIDVLIGLYSGTHGNESTALICKLIENAKAFNYDGLPDDMLEEAKLAMQATMTGLQERLDAALVREAEAAELEQLRKEKEEWDLAQAKIKAAELKAEAAAERTLPAEADPVKPISEASTLPQEASEPEPTLSQGEKAPEQASASVPAQTMTEQAIEDLAKEIGMIEATIVVEAIIAGRIRNVTLRKDRF